MNKSELVAAIADSTGESQAAVNRIVDAMFEEEEEDEDEDQ